MDARKTLAALTASLLLAGTAAAKPAPSHQLVVAKKRIKAQQKAIRARNATIKALRLRIKAAPHTRTVTVNVPGPTVTVPGPTVTVPASCPVPAGVMQAVAAMSADQAWSLLPTIYSIIRAKADGESYDANPDYDANRSNSTYESFTSEYFSFSRYLDR